jgi:ABC-2 type transport system permease protein
MSIARTWAVTLRIVRQFRRDPRTLILLFAVPAVVILLVGYLLRSSSGGIKLGFVEETGGAAAPALETLGRTLSEAGVTSQFLSRAEAEQQVEGGDLDGAIIIAPAARGVDADARSVAVLLEGSNAQRNKAILRIAGQVSLAISTASALPASSGPPDESDLSVTYYYGGPDFETIDSQAPPLVGFYAFFFVFLLTTVSFLRERTAGTLERLMVTPTTRAELVLGYVAGFGIFAVLQAALILLVTIVLLQVEYTGSLALVVLLVVTVTVAAANLGIFLSTFARTELQAVQFIPIVIVPQGLLSSVIWPIDTLPRWLQGVAHLLPLTYSNEALRNVMIRGQGLLDAGVGVNFLALLGFAAFFVVIASATLRREVG